MEICHNLGEPALVCLAVFKKDLDCDWAFIIISSGLGVAKLNLPGSVNNVGKITLSRSVFHCHLKQKLKLNNNKIYFSSNY